MQHSTPYYNPNFKPFLTHPFQSHQNSNRNNRRIVANNTGSSCIIHLNACTAEHLLWTSQCVHPTGAPASAAATAAAAIDVLDAHIRRALHQTTGPGADISIMRGRRHRPPPRIETEAGITCCRIGMCKSHQLRASHSQPRQPHSIASDRWPKVFACTQNVHMERTQTDRTAAPTNGYHHRRRPGSVLDSLRCISLPSLSPLPSPNV